MTIDQVSFLLHDAVRTTLLVTAPMLAGAVGLGLAGGVLFRFIPFGFLLGLLVGFAISEVLRRYGSAGNLMQSGLIAAAVAWLTAAGLVAALGGSFAAGLQAFAFDAAIAGAVVWFRLR